MSTTGTPNPAPPPAPAAPTPGAAIASLETDVKSLLASHMGDLKTILTNFTNEIAARAGASASTWIPETQKALDAWVAKL